MNKKYVKSESKKIGDKGLIFVNKQKNKICSKCSSYNVSTKGKSLGLCHSCYMKYRVEKAEKENIINQMCHHIMNVEIYIQRGEQDIKTSKEYIELCKDYIHYLDKKAFERYFDEENSFDINEIRKRIVHEAELHFQQNDNLLRTMWDSIIRQATSNKQIRFNNQETNNDKIIIKFSDAWKLYNTKYDWFNAKKSPVTIKAIQIDKDFAVKTIEGIMKGSKDDYLVEGIEHEIYPVKKTIFEKTYRRTK